MTQSELIRRPRTFHAVFPFRPLSLIPQLIYERYRHPFLLTWLGASLLAIYLPISYIREFLAPCFAQAASHFSKLSHRSEKNSSAAASGSTAASLKKAVSPRHGPREIELGVRDVDGDKESGDEAEDDEESASLIAKGVAAAAGAGVGGGGEERKHGHAHAQGHGHSQHGTEMTGTRELIRVASMLAPMWLLTEVSPGVGLDSEGCLLWFTADGRNSMWAIFSPRWIKHDKFVLANLPQGVRRATEAGIFPEFLGTYHVCCDGNQLWSKDNR